MTATWESRDYDLTFSTMAGPLLQPPHYKFKLARKLATGDTVFYNLVADAENPPPAHAFSGCNLLLQPGRPLIHYLPKNKRLDSGAASYLTDLDALIDEIVGAKIDADPMAYERLVGFISLPGSPANPIAFYKVENTHKNGELLVVVLLQTIGVAPGGSIGIIGR